MKTQTHRHQSALKTGGHGSGLNSGGRGL